MHPDHDMDVREGKGAAYTRIMIGNNTPTITCEAWNGVAYVPVMTGRNNLTITQHTHPWVQDG